MYKNYNAQKKYFAAGTNSLMKDLTIRTLKRLCGTEDFQWAWERLSSDGSLTSALDNDILRNIKRQKKSIKNIGDIIEDTKKILDTKFNYHELVSMLNAILYRIALIKEILDALEKTVNKGQKPVYLWDKLPFECNETKAKAVLNSLYPDAGFPLVEPIELNVEQFINEFDKLYKQCDDETANAENIEAAKEKWWKQKSKMGGTSSSYSIYIFQDRESTIDWGDNKSKTVRNILEFIIDVPKFCDEELKEKMEDFTNGLSLRESKLDDDVIYSLYDNINTIYQPKYNLDKCIKDLAGTIIDFFKRKNIWVKELHLSWSRLMDSFSKTNNDSLEDLFTHRMNNEDETRPESFDMSDGVEHFNDENIEPVETIFENTREMRTLVNKVLYPNLSILAFDKAMKTKARIEDRDKVDYQLVYEHAYRFFKVVDMLKKQIIKAVSNIELVGDEDQIELYKDPDDDAESLQVIIKFGNTKILTCQQLKEMENKLKFFFYYIGIAENEIYIKFKLKFTNIILQNNKL